MKGRALRDLRKQVLLGRRSRGGVLPVVLMMSILAGLMLLAAPARSADGPEEPVWTFDFRLTFTDVTFRNTRNAVIVGSRGTILTSHERYPNLWSPRDSGTKELLTCVSFADDRHGWAAGHRGIILQTEDGGKSWRIQRPAADENQPLFDIQFVSAQTGFACGAYDTFLRTADGGANWTRIPTGSEFVYSDLAFRDAQEGYLVGEFGTVLHTTDAGDSWEKFDLGGRAGSLFGIALVSPQDLLVFGIAGKIYRSGDGGRNWESVPSGVYTSLFRAAVKGNEVILVGASGGILCSTDGGRSFFKRIDKDMTGFAGVCLHPGGGFLCAGETGKIFRLDTLQPDK
jgi:photosystem II stability/assembly factor-like uncharacterized protein